MSVAEISKYAYLPYFSSATGASSDEDNGNWSEKREHYLNAKGDNHCVKENNQLQIGCLLLTENEEKLLYQTVKTLKGDKDALLPFTYTAEFYDDLSKTCKAILYTNAQRAPTIFLSDRKAGG